MKRAVIGAIAGAVIFAGCAGTTPSLGKLGKSGNYESAERTGGFNELSKGLVKKEKDDLLWYLDAGLISKYAKDFNQSVYFFDKSEVKIKQYDKEVLGGKMLANVGAVLTNDTFMDYRPRIYEGIMVNTYKGIDFLSQGKNADARVEFNRALERQRRAKEFFAKEIAQEKKKIEEENKKKLKKKKVNPLAFQKATTNPKTKDAIEKRYSNLFAFKPYPDFVNPFTSYMSGLFFLVSGDYAKARNILKETYGMIKGNEAGAKYVEDDLKIAVNGKSKGAHYAWVVFANGKGPVKKELRFDIPLFLVTSKMFYTGIALPTFKEMPAAYSYLKVQNGTKIKETKEVASMDKVIKTEFKKRFPSVMARAIARTVTQSLIQYQLRKRGGLIGGIIGSVYQGVMNRADTRQWKLLPKNFQVARVRLRGNSLNITTPDGKNIVQESIDPNRDYIVFVRIIDRVSKPIYNIVTF